MAPRLKVFVTSDGLTDYVVAVSSRAKALAAWGVRQDLFAEARAHEVDDPELVEAATQRPGEVLRRAAGTRGTLAKPTPAKAAKPSGPSKAELRKVADLERRLAGLDRAHQAAMAALQVQKAELDRRIVALRDKQVAERERIEAALSAAKRALA